MIVKMRVMGEEKGCFNNVLIIQVGMARIPSWLFRCASISCTESLSNFEINMFSSSTQRRCLFSNAMTMSSTGTGAIFLPRIWLDPNWLTRPLYAAAVLSLFWCFPENLSGVKDLVESGGAAALDVDVSSRLGKPHCSSLTMAPPYNGADLCSTAGETLRFKRRSVSLIKLLDDGIRSNVGTVRNRADWRYFFLTFIFNTTPRSNQCF